MGATARRSYASGNFEFQIDGHQPTSYWDVRFLSAMRSSDGITEVECHTDNFHTAPDAPSLTDDARTTHKTMGRRKNR